MLKNIVGRVKHRFWSTDEILLLVRPAGKPSVELTKPQTEGNQLIYVSGNSLEDCGAFEDKSHYVPIYRGMINQGDVVCFGYVDGQCAMRICLKKSGILEFDGIPIRKLGDHKSLIHYGYTAPEYRGRGLHSGAIHRFFADNPEDTIFALVKESNAASLRGFFKNGFLVGSRLKAKNRLFHRSVREIPLSENESNEIIEKTMRKRTIG